MFSLKKISCFGSLGVSALLLLVIFLGIRQYNLTEKYSAVISQSEKIIFHFATIREQITTSLIQQDWSKTVSSADQLKSLHSSLARLQENPLIPGEYRLDMAKQVDLSGLAIFAREIVSEGDKTAQSLSLQKKMRRLSEYLMQFDRIIVSQMRAKVVQFQTAMIGALGAVICLISFYLLILYKKIIFPLIRLSEQTKEDEVLSNGFAYDNDSFSELVHFADFVNSIIEKNSQNREDNILPLCQNEEISSLINESTNLSNGIINYAQLLFDSCEETGGGTEEKEILRNIITAAERIAQLNKEI